MEKKQIGVLAVQGAFAEHIAMVRRLGAEAFEIRQLPDLERPMDGLILPGGESTAMRKLLDELGLYEPLRVKIAAGLPVYGTCAGLLLLAKEIEGGTPCFATMDVSAVRNAYGRQLGSFYTEAEFAGLGTIPMTFIRAPYIASVQKNERKCDFTLTECGMSLKEAGQEARRCLRCDHFGYGNFKGGRTTSW